MAKKKTIAAVCRAVCRAVLAHAALMLHARGVESSASDPPDGKAEVPTVTGSAEREPDGQAGDAEPAGPSAPNTRRRSETYVARRSPAAVAGGLRGLAQRAYEARWTLRVISVTAAAAGATWAVCLPFGDFAPAFGAASAVYAVQLTVRTSVLDGAKRTVLMGISVFLAVLILRTVGLSDVAVIALVFVSLGVGQLLRLGLSGSLQIPGTAIFILALGTTVTTPELLNRVWATLVGAVIGAAASYAAYPGEPRGTRPPRPRRARRRDRRPPLRHERRGGEKADGDRDRTLARPVAGARRGSAEGGAARRRGGGVPADRSLRSPRQLVGAVPDPCDSPALGQRRSAGSPARSSITSSRVVPPGFRQAWLRCWPAPPSPTGRQADALDRDGTSVDAALESVRQARQESLRSLRRVDETGAWVVSGAILTDVDRMVRQLEGDTPALAVPTESPRRQAPLGEAPEPPHRPHLKPVGQPASRPSGISFIQLMSSTSTSTVSRQDRGSHGTRSRHRTPVRNVRPEPNSRRVRAARSLRAACRRLTTRQRHRRRQPARPHRPPTRRSRSRGAGRGWRGRASCRRSWCWR